MENVQTIYQATVLHEAVRYEQASSEELLRGALELMRPEFVSAGGNIRDKSLEDLHQFLGHRGQLWVAHLNGTVVATTTVEGVWGSRGPWYYINNGVVAPHLRRQSSGIVDGLLKQSITTIGEHENYFVISVVWGVFERQGFSQATVEELRIIDAPIGELVASKLRPGKTVYIGIRTGGGDA